MKIKIPTELHAQLRVALLAQFNAKPTLTWKEISAGLRVSVPATTSPDFNWIMARAVMQGIRQVKRTPDVHNEVYVFDGG